MDAEERRKKKLRRISAAGAWSLGIGLGALIARFIAPLFIGLDDSMNEVFSAIGMVLMLYGLAQLVSVLLMEKHAGKIDTVLTYLIMPAIILKMIMDYNS